VTTSKNHPTRKLYTSELDLPEEHIKPFFDWYAYRHAPDIYQIGFEICTSYRAIEGDKGVYFDVLYAGRDAPPHLTQTMFSMLPADKSKSTPVEGLGDKAIFCPNETGMAMLHVLKGDILITIGFHGQAPKTVLDSEKSLATKILANL